ncbi:hypothetical protein C2G38_2160185 [Gigaspora rosea]|uniref:Uncharacterized protein n=1 Tax=Gigaspora rosea TaxID=44941 RepID=A0A397W1U8_9GLOM|nr:hypothetical protein C2G38_2160185 [Gigaspora rosea]
MHFLFFVNYISILTVTFCNQNLNPDYVVGYARIILTLTSLNLAGNDLGVDGVKAFADALCKNSTLTSLILYNNNLGIEEGKA